MATKDFNHKDIIENGRGLKYTLVGFNPAQGHTCGATVSNNELVTYAEMGLERHEDVIPNVGLDSNEVNCEGREDTVEVHFNRAGYDIKNRLPH